ncbi:MAG TPA: SRPBCC family protein [Bradyrhizobium sp.]|nr:SRPBCC family protein [Bradyrhizobium sp.]
MIFENSFVVAAAPDDAWKIILNVPEIAPCLPGANLTEQVDDNTYKGNVSVKLGPVALTFNGTAQIVQRDDAEHTAAVRANGSDLKGRGAAKAEARFKLLPDPRGSKVQVVTDLTLTGSVAQYGRGAGLIQSVASGLIEQFEQRLNERLGKVVTSDGNPAAGEAATPAPPNTIGLKMLWRILVASVKNMFR